MHNKKYMHKGVIIYILSAILPVLGIMDSLLQLLLAVFSSLLALGVSICIYYLHQSRKPHKKAHNIVPEAGGAWPIIGHMHLFGGRKLTFKTLGAMAEKYGPVFTIRLGSHKTLVVSNWEVAKECLSVHGKNFSGKPDLQASRLLGYNHAMFGFAPYGPYWREMRKIATVELLSNQRLEMFKHIRASEVKTSIQELYKTYTSRRSTESGVLIEMKQWFKDLTHGINLRMVAGRRFFGSGGSDDGDKGRNLHCQKLVRDFFYFSGVSMFSDAIPFLEWLDFGGYEKAMKRTAKELDAMVEEWLDEHKQARLLGGEGKEEHDFMDVMLRIVADGNISGFDADTIAKATCLNLIIAGESSMVPLVWTLSLLLNNPHVLKKAQNELDFFVGKDKLVKESDIGNLVYLQAIVKESFRLYPPGPIIPRATLEDCTLSNGYHVAAGTRVLFNIWNIQHDELVWSNPNEFQPERFLTDHKDTDLRGQNFELIPFGSGRRSCAGLSLALQVVHLTLASLLHSFEVATPSNDAVDMTESPGLTNEKATPLEVLLTPRLDSEIYTQYID